MTNPNQTIPGLDGVQLALKDLRSQVSKSLEKISCVCEIEGAIDSLTAEVKIISGLLVPAAPAVVKENYVLIRDEKPQSTDGGTFTNGAWRTRDLNAEVVDTDDLATLNLNQVTLQPGKYSIRASAPAMGVQRHQTRLQNITTGTTEFEGTSEHVNTTSVNRRSYLSGRIDIAVATTFEVQHRSQSTGTGNGFGEGANFTTEVFTVFEAIKLKD